MGDRGLTRLTYYLLKLTSVSLSDTLHVAAQLSPFLVSGMLQKLAAIENLLLRWTTTLSFFFHFHFFPTHLLSTCKNLCFQRYEAFTAHMEETFTLACCDKSTY